MEGYSVRQLSQQSGHSKNKLFRIVNFWLNRIPDESESTMEKHEYLIFDGTFLRRPTSLVALMDAMSNKIIDGQYGVNENSEKQLLQFLEPLIAKGLNPVACTVDGNPQAINVLRKLWPNITIQRCLVHIQRQGLMWCRRYPKTLYGRKLRDIFLRVTSTRTKEERDKFFEMVIQWEKEFGQYIGLQPEKGRVFSDIKRARSMLLKALPSMFHYLDNPSISSTTNGLEGYFSRLKGHYQHHRGLRKNKLNSYFKWYLFYKPK